MNNSLSEQEVREFGSYFRSAEKAGRQIVSFLNRAPPAPHFIVKEICSLHTCYMLHDRCACSVCSVPSKAVQPVMYWYFCLTKYS